MGSKKCRSSSACTKLQYLFYVGVVVLLIFHKRSKLHRHLDEQNDNEIRSVVSKEAKNDKVLISKLQEANSYWDKEIEKKVFPEKMPNKNLVFHNKLPKSGSSTMNNIIKVMSEKLNFGFLKVEAGEMSTGETEKLIKYIDEVKTDKFLLLKHHEYLDFTQFNREQPTYINVMRDPIEWFTSRYYFSRYGWSRKPGCREDCGMSEEEKDMTIDECVQRRHIQCTQPWIYISFFCDITNPKCANLTTNEQKKEAVEIAKYNILHNYYAVGILEQFEDTLNLFERLLPTFFKDATNTWKSAFVQTQQAKTKTVNKKEMNEASKKYFQDGPLHYEIELYEFARKVFNERLKRLNIEPAVIEE